MTLLHEIRDAVTDPTVDILTLLRKCRILASRLKNDQLKQWVENELNGYAKGEVLPSYRKTEGRSRGNFFERLSLFSTHKKYTFVEIPLSRIPEKFRGDFRKVALTEGIGSLFDLAKSNGNIKVGWPTDLYSVFGNSIFPDMDLFEAWFDIPKGVAVNIVETVRTRILSFVLEIEAINPEAGESSSSKTPLPNQQVTQVFNQYIFNGNVGNMAANSANIQQGANLVVVQGDFKTLRQELERHEISNGDILELEEAVKAEPVAEKGKFGNRASAWLGKMISKAASGTWKVSTDVATKVLSDAISAYYGIGKP